MHFKLEEQIVIPFNLKRLVAHKIDYIMQRGGRGIEFNEINNYNQLYLEPLEQYNDRKTKIVDVIDRVLHIDHVESAYDVPERRIMKNIT